MGTARILAVRTLNVPGFIWASCFPRATAGEFELEDPKKLLNLLLKNVGAAGLFETAARIEEVWQDKDLDVLPQRWDFQELFLTSRPKATP